MEFQESQLVQGRAVSGGDAFSSTTQGYYKRGVLKAPPKHFVVEVLPHRKLGSAHAYGMRIYPINAAGVPLGDTMSMRTSTSSSSSSSSGSTTSRSPYEIWRRWEDCLWFQEQLEGEYRLLAQQKRTRLQRGKGVKKDGIYVHSDQAASFESLPPGPDANDIAKGIHSILPKLSKKGTFFKASKDFIDQRQREFKALIEKLWDDDELPTLVKEMREIREIRDFFGYWNRDRDRERKVASLTVQDKGKARMSVSSLASSMFSRPDPEFVSYPSSPFSASSLSLNRHSRPTSPVGSVSTVGASGQSSVSASTRRPRAASAPKPSPLKSYAVPPSPASIAAKARSSTLSVPTSISSRSLWTPHAPAANSTASHISFTVAEDGVLVPAAPWGADDGDDPLASSFLVFSTAAESKAKATHAALEVLREESESDVDAPVPDTPMPAPPCTAPPCTAPTRRPRNLSCPDPGFRHGLVWPHCALRPSSVLSEPSLDSSSPTSPTDSEVSDRWEDALDGGADGTSDTGPHRRASLREPARCGGPSRPHTMYSTFSTCSEQESFFDAFGLDDAGFDADDVLGDGARHMRASVATMNSVMTDASVDAVLPRRGSVLVQDRPGSPTPSSTGSSSSDHTHMCSSSPTSSSSPSLRTPSMDTMRSLSNGSQKYRLSIAMPDSPLFPPSEEEGQWGEDGPDEDFVDSYFYDPAQHPLRPGSETPHRARVSQTISVISTPEHFPKPFQHRPPGQFHLPWSPACASSASYSSAGATPASPTSTASVMSDAPGAEHFTVKAVRQDSIVLLRATHAMPLAQVRARLRDKFAAQEGVRLTDAFTIGFSPAGAASGERPRSQSASGPRDGRQQQQRLQFITSDEDWEQAAAGSAGKLTIHIFDRF